MSEKQITIDYKNRCENYSKGVGCYNTFDGSCIKEQCFTYRLLQLLKAKEQECKELNKQIEILTMQLENLNEKFSRKRAVIEFADCPSYSYGDNTFEPTCTKNFCYDVKSCNHKNMVKYEQTLTEIKEIAEQISLPMGTGKSCNRVILAKQILQKISECEVRE